MSGPGALPGPAMGESLAADPAGNNCWDCRAKVAKSAFVCHSCKAILPSIGTQNPFEIFALPLEFDLSDRLLERQYKSIQRQLHPDLHSSGSKQQRLYSEQRSSEVNEAYNILLDPLKRAKLLLRLKGVSIGEEAESIQDAEFLMEIMDIRERVDELIQRNELEGLAQIFGEISARILKIVGEIGHCFQEDKLEDVRNLVYKLVYFYRIQERIDPYIPTA